MKTRFLLIMLFLLSLSACTSSDYQDGTIGTGIDFPERDISMIIPFGRGNASDVFGREFSALLSSQLPVKVVPLNKSGSGGLQGMLYAASLPADGYTILEITPSHIIADVLHRSPKLGLMDTFKPLALVQNDYYVLFSNNSPDAINIYEFLEPSSTREYTVAGVSPHGLDEITLSLLAEETGKKLKFVPYQSSQAIRAALLSGEVDLYLGKLISSIKHIRSGRLRPLMVLNEGRLENLKELAAVPSSVELGYQITTKSWRGFVVLKETPNYIRDYLADQIRYVANGTAYKKKLGGDFSAQALDFKGPEQFDRFLRQQFDYYQGLVKK